MEMSIGLKQGYLKEEPTQPTKRYCQYLKINEETVDEYKYWHDSRHIWKEIPEGIRQVGILDMEIYIIGDMAFMIIETIVDFDWDEAFSRLASYDRQLEWENFVSRFQNVIQSDKRSEEKWQLVERVFSLTDALAHKD